MGNGLSPNKTVKYAILVSRTSFTSHLTAIKQLADGSETQNPVQWCETEKYTGSMLSLFKL